jgi:hypothetical protein
MHLADSAEPGHILVDAVSECTVAATRVKTHKCLGKPLEPDTREAITVG